MDMLMRAYFKISNSNTFYPIKLLQQVKIRYEFLKHAENYKFWSPNEYRYIPIEKQMPGYYTSPKSVFIWDLHNNMFPKQYFAQSSGNCLINEGVFDIPLNKNNLLSVVLENNLTYLERKRTILIFRLATRTTLDENSCEKLLRWCSYSYEGDKVLPEEFKLPPAARFSIFKKAKLFRQIAAVDYDIYTINNVLHNIQLLSVEEKLPSGYLPKKDGKYYALFDLYPTKGSFTRMNQLLLKYPPDPWKDTINFGPQAPEAYYITYRYLEYDKIIDEAGNITFERADSSHTITFVYKTENYFLKQSLAHLDRRNLLKNK